MLRVDPSLKATESFRISVTPELAERFNRYTAGIAIGQRQFAAVCFALGFAALTSAVPTSVGAAGSAEDLLGDVVASLQGE